MLSKFIDKSAQNASIFSSKANYARGLLKVILMGVCTAGILPVAQLIVAFAQKMFTTISLIAVGFLQAYLPLTGADIEEVNERTSPWINRALVFN